MHTIDLGAEDEALPDETLGHVRSVLKQIRSDPIPSLQYIRDVVLFTLTAKDFGAQPNGLGMEWAIDVHALRKQAQIDPILGAIIRIIVQHGGAVFVDDVLQLYDIPTREYDAAPDTFYQEVSSVLVLLLQLSPDIGQLFLADGRLEKVIDVAYDDSTTSGVRRMAAGTLISAFGEHPAWTAPLDERFHKADPWQSVLVMHALFLSGLGLPTLISLGALRCLTKCAETISESSPCKIKALVQLLREAFEIMHPKRRHFLNTSADRTHLLACRVRLSMDTRFLSPPNVTALVSGWLSQTELVPSATLSDLMADILSYNGGVRLQIVAQVLDALDNVDVNTSEGEGVIFAVSTFFSQQSIPHHAKKVLYSDSRVTTKLLSVLTSLRSRSTPPYTAEHLAAHALAALIRLGSSKQHIYEELVTDEKSFTSVLGTISQISEYDPFVDVRQAVGEHAMGGPLLLNTILDTWEDIARPVIHAYLVQTFKTTSPSSGAGILLHHLAHQDLVNRFVEDGVVSYCFRIGCNTTQGDIPWENALRLLAFLARYDRGVVDVFAVEGAKEMILQNLSQPAVAKLLCAIASTSGDAMLAKLREEGIVDALASVLLDSTVEPAVRMAIVHGLKELVSRSDDTLRVVAAKDGIVAAVVGVLFGQDGVGTTLDENMGSSSGVDAATLLGNLARRNADGLTAAFRTRISPATDFVSRVALLGPLELCLATDNTTTVLRTAVISAGCIPLLLDIIADPWFITPENYTVQDRTAALLVQAMSANPTPAPGQLVDAPSAVDLFIDWTQTSDASLRRFGISGLVAILDWESSEELMGDLRRKMLDPLTGVVKVVLDSLPGRNSIRSSPVNDFHNITAQGKLTKRKQENLELLDLLSADEETFGAARARLIEAGATGILKGLLTLEATRPRALKILRRIERDTLAEIPHDSDTDSVYVDALCDILISPEPDIDENIVAMKEMSALLPSQKAEDLVAKRPRAIQSLIDGLFASMDDNNLTERPATLPSELEESTGQEAEDMRMAAGDILDAVDVSEPLRPLARSLVDQIRERLTNAHADDADHLLASVFSTIERSQGSIRQLFMLANLPTFVTRVLQDPEAPTSAVKTSVQIIDDLAPKLEFAQAFLNAGAADALVEIIKSAPCTASDGFRRLVPFKALVALAPHFTSNIEGAEAFDSPTPLVLLATEELRRDLTEGRQVDASGATAEWGDLLARSLARIAPLSLLDRMLANPALSVTVVEAFKECTVAEVLRDLRDDLSEPGPYDFGTQGDMSQLAAELLKRIEPGGTAPIS